MLPQILRWDAVDQLADRGDQPVGVLFEAEQAAMEAGDVAVYALVVGPIALEVIFQPAHAFAPVVLAYCADALPRDRGEPGVTT